MSTFKDVEGDLVGYLMIDPDDYQRGAILGFVAVVLASILVTAISLAARWLL